VLDITLIRAPPDVVRESQRRRFKKEEEIDRIIQADLLFKKARHELDNANGQRKKITEEVSQLKRNVGVVGIPTSQNQQNADELLIQRGELDTKIELLKKEVAAKEIEVQILLNPIGNIVHDSVPISNDENNNIILRKWGDFTPKQNQKYHHHLLEMVDGYDSERGIKVAAHRGYFLKGIGARLNLALMSYGLDFLAKRGYVELQAPVLMKKTVMAKTAQLEQFDEELFKVVGNENEEDKYLIATSEQPISAYHQDEWLEHHQLPIKYAGLSSCFRKEAGKQGKDAWGIFRVHQFEKVEQFVLTAPDKSWEMHEDMLKASEEFYQALGIPYQVVVIVSGELNNAAAKKYDLEGWFPGNEDKNVPAHFRELVSCSNCTDYQSRNLEVRYRPKGKDNKEKQYVHMLNSTLCATTRTICAILENFQTPEGVIVPDVLQPYLGGLKIIPYVHKEIRTTKGAKGQEKQKGKGKQKAEEGQKEES